MTALTAKITAIAVAAALALTGGLAIKMAQGDDPALSAKKSSTSTVTATAAATPSTDSTPATVTTRTS